MKRTTVFVVIGVAVILFILYGYNTMVSLHEEVSKGWANVEAQYQRRADLIPNVLATVHGSTAFEQQLLMELVEARNKATEVSAYELTKENFAEFNAAQSQLSNALADLMVLVEDYPEIKSTQAYRDLIVELEGSENRISKARTDFNATVSAYNAYVKQFPQVIYSGFIGYDKRPYFESKSYTEPVPNINFDNE